MLDNREVKAQVIAKTRAIKEVEGGYAVQSQTSKRFYFVNELGGTAYIPYKSNITATSHTGNKGKLWRKMFHYFQMNQEEFLEHYHKRSNAETTFHMLKMKLGDSLKSKNFIAQKNELLCKVITHNILVLNHEIHEIGVSSDSLKEMPINKQAFPLQNSQ